MDEIKVFVEITTTSNGNLEKQGTYSYINDPLFEFVSISFALELGKVYTIDCQEKGIMDKLYKDIDIAGNDGTDPKEYEKVYSWDAPRLFAELLTNKLFKLYSWDAQFTRVALSKQICWNIVDLYRWVCITAKTAYCGLPTNIKLLPGILHLQNSKTETSLQKLLLSRELWFRLADEQLDPTEKEAYVLDQRINDRGIGVDMDFVEAAAQLASETGKHATTRLMRLTGLENPNSIQDLKKWLSKETGADQNDLTKSKVQELIDKGQNKLVAEVLLLRQTMAKMTSLKKYEAMENTRIYREPSKYCTIMNDYTHDFLAGTSRIYGLFQYFGARTGRWTSKLVQLQNLPRNTIESIEFARDLVKEKDTETLKLMYGNDINNILSNLIRTSFIPLCDEKSGAKKTFLVADFSAIEARCLSWVSGAEWKLDVFRTTGKIYEAMAAKMFNKPIEEIGHDSIERMKGKFSELALGYNGSEQALMNAAGDLIKFTLDEAKETKDLWRKKNPEILLFWKVMESAAISAIRTGGTIKTLYKGITFSSNQKYLSILLPSGRKLLYYSPRILINKFGGSTIGYMGVNNANHKFGIVTTYGGKLTENIVSAIARDILRDAMIRLSDNGYQIVMHVHDEVVCEDMDEWKDQNLDDMIQIMTEPVPWALDLPLAAEGYATPFYQKK